MTRSFSKRNLLWATTIMSVLLAASFAVAGGKGGGGQGASKDRPQESTSLNYGKVQQTYTSRKKGLAQGQHYKDVTITHGSSTQK